MQYKIEKGLIIGECVVFDHMTESRSEHSRTEEDICNPVIPLSKEVVTGIFTKCVILLSANIP